MIDCVQGVTEQFFLAAFMTVNPASTLETKKSDNE